MQSTILSNSPKSGQADGCVDSTGVCLKDNPIKDVPPKVKPMGRSGG